MDIDIDYGRAIQSLTIMDKQLCYPLSESGNAQIFEKKTIARAQEALEQAQEYIGFLYDKHKKLQQSYRRLQKKKGIDTNASLEM
jgi:hypothetical protein